MRLKKTALLSAAAFLFVGISSTHLAVGQELTALPTQNGDVNGDGEIDLSDAIYLLNYKFSGGPKPVEFLCPVPRATESDVIPFYDRTKVVGSSRLLRDADGLTLTNVLAQQEALRLQAEANDYF